MALYPDDNMNTSLQDLVSLELLYKYFWLRTQYGTNGPKAGVTSHVTRIGDGGNHG